jgi:hypothetical protein
MSTPCDEQQRHGQAHDVARAGDRVELYDALRHAADEVGHKELLYAVGDMDRTSLTKRLTAGDSKQPTVGMLLELVRAQQSGRLLATLCRLSGYAPAKRLADETAGERLERLVGAVRERLGQSGEDIIQEVLGRQG